MANPAEPLMVHEIPGSPGQNRSDRFLFEGRDYVCTMDYMSNFWEIDHLQNTLAKTVITKLKHNCTRYEIQRTDLNLVVM